MEDDDDDDDLDDLEQDSFNILYRLVEDKTPPPSPVIRPKKSASSVEARYGINMWSHRSAIERCRSSATAQLCFVHH